MTFWKYVLGVTTAVVLAAQVDNAWATGAIAVDDQGGSKPSDAGYGIGFGDTKQAAMAAAMEKCKSFGNDSCKVIVWFKKCGAYASSNEKYGYGYGDSEEIAKSAALDMCGNSGCRVVASDCGD